MDSNKSKYVYSTDEKLGIRVAVKDTDIEAFDVRLLNLGDIKSPSHPIDVLAVLFDLEGFTNFTKQVDPQLTVPIFLSDFLHWLFSAIKKQLVQDEASAILWAEFPFFSKFMGDGVLFLWRIDLDSIIGIDPTRPTDKLQYEIQEFVCNIISSLWEVCREYKKFVKTVETQHVDPPPSLRCGIARGTVIPIGQGSDFVGPCINIAARLQKFNGLSFAFSARGIDNAGFGKSYSKYFVKKRSSIRGIGDKELVYVVREEFEALDEELISKLNEP